jgi:hypothetical protein
VKQAVLFGRPDEAAMMSGRLPHRARGEGWEVWLDDEGFLWTRDAAPMTETQARIRIAAMERFLARRPVKGVVVDDREPGGRDAPEAWEAYRLFLATHPGLPWAVMTSRGTDTFEGTLESRHRLGNNMAVFGSEEAAKAWLRAHAPAEPVKCQHDPLAWAAPREDP